MTKKILGFFREKIILSLVENKFEPLENALSFSSMIHGMMILLIPIFSGVAAFGSINAFEASLGILLLSSGLVLLTASCVHNLRARRIGALVQFMSWIALSVMISFSPVFATITPLVYITLSLVYGFIYLHLAVGSDLVSGSRDGG